MERRGHKHKETFSVLLISNTGQRSRQFHISQTGIRLFIIFVVFLMAAVGGMSWLIYKINPLNNKQDDLRAQLESQEELVSQLEAEKKTWEEEKKTLVEENEALRQEKEDKVEEDEEEESEATKEVDTDIPRRYPSAGVSAVIASYSEETPYLAINTHTEGNIVATANGTVVRVTSDDTYPVIVEVEHGKNYGTRYMCRQEAEVVTSEGAQVEVGDTLFTITVDDTQLDYQITFEGEPIDPLTVIEAKG